MSWSNPKNKNAASGLIHRGQRQKVKISRIYSEFVQIEDIFYWTLASNCILVIFSHICLLIISNSWLIFRDNSWGTIWKLFQDPRNIEHFFQVKFLKFSLFSWKKWSEKPAMKKENGDKLWIISILSDNDQNRHLLI